jgi:hypothetical protein
VRDCDATPHYSCADCGGEEFIVEVIGYGQRRAGTLDEDHRVEDWETERDTSRGSEWLGAWRYYVRCQRCDREIPFGWSHEDRGGRIWPADAACFNPRRCWPEPRYRRSILVMRR